MSNHRIFKLSSMTPMLTSLLAMCQTKGWNHQQSSILLSNGTRRTISMA
ncbi:BgTH12-04915 [Blumeria graminis f. sp. triticale]|uniref:BgTH12-04915 n=1 Tax=Blumeria graminis f. sp. triticale TaxID=1689686 RepID=A0A9W4CVG2_BLUGR|nr:BgTH12-04915 [Blumeria graminis f. sp. triticale]